MTIRACRRFALLTLGAALITSVLPGCGKKGSIAADTAAGTAQAFVEALKAKDYARAASAFDYVTTARKQNEDWDSIPGGQRDLIVKKLIEEKAGEMEAVAQRLGGSPQCGEVGQGGVVTVTGSAGAVSLEMVAQDGKWYIAQLW